MTLYISNTMYLIISSIAGSAKPDDSTVQQMFAKLVGSSSFLAMLGIISAVIVTFRVFSVAKKEQKEITEDIDRTVQNIIQLRKEEDVFTLMLKNVGELREYYIINKQQARRSFSGALIACFLGFLVFCIGFYLNQNRGNSIVLLTIAGSIIEIVSGLFFWLYKKALDQINLFHFSLLKTEKFLTAIKLVEKISADKRDENYAYIIKAIITSDIFEKETQWPPVLKVGIRWPNNQSLAASHHLNSLPPHILQQRPQYQYRVQHED